MAEESGGPHWSPRTVRWFRLDEVLTGQIDAADPCLRRTLSRIDIDTSGTPVRWVQHRIRYTDLSVIRGG